MDVHFAWLRDQAKSENQERRQHRGGDEYHLFRISCEENDPDFTEGHIKLNGGVSICPLPSA